MTDLNQPFLFELRDNKIIQQARILTTDAKKNLVMPFKDHPQLPFLIDSLCRKYYHHLFLKADFQCLFYQAFFEALAYQCHLPSAPLALRDALVLTIPVDALLQNDAIQALQAIRDCMIQRRKAIMMILDVTTLTEQSHQQLIASLSILLNCAWCRCLLISPLITNTAAFLSSAEFQEIIITKPTEQDVLMLLKYQRQEIENHHHVLIPEELLAQAYALSARFLSIDQPLIKTLQLLDSAAARAASQSASYLADIKPVVTTAILTQALSHWTQIPPSFLHINRFQASEFTQNMLQRIFGQDAAITLMAQALQQSHAYIQQHQGIFCSLLLAGPAHTGKKTTAIALTEQLFKQIGALFIADSISVTTNTIFSIKFQRCTDKQYFNLKDIMQHSPYAVLMIEHIERAPSVILNQLATLQRTGLLHDDQNTAINFRQATLILSTTLETAPIVCQEEADSMEKEEALNLMQLVMNESKTTSYTHHLSPYEMAEQFKLELHQLPFSLGQTHVIPFLPLKQTSVEKIIQLKIKLLNKLVHSRYGIELSYAIEVIHFLAKEAMNNKKTDWGVDINNVLKQLYCVVEQAILTQMDNKNRPTQLFLQLNETGQVLRCDWLISSTGEHTN
jgi:ATP-dependent Clp protease ATP-binding subunit ClpA